MLLVLLIGWIVFSYLFAEFAPVIFMGIAYLIGYLFLCLWEVIKLTARILAWLTGRAFGMAGLALRKGSHGLYLGALFVFYLVDEWRRGPVDDVSGDDSADERTAQGSRAARAARSLRGRARNARPESRLHAG